MTLSQILELCRFGRAISSLCGQVSIGPPDIVQISDDPLATKEVPNGITIQFWTILTQAGYDFTNYLMLARLGNNLAALSKLGYAQGNLAAALRMLSDNSKILISPVKFKLPKDWDSSWPQRFGRTAWIKMLRSTLKQVDTLLKEERSAQVQQGRRKKCA
ncbi:hypothetical protein JNK13_04965 [bacterium]|nr:hypothetical protein [bacterium]